jgi:hypothetical protein
MSTHDIKFNPQHDQYLKAESINLKPAKDWIVYAISIFALIVSILTAIAEVIPDQIGEAPVVMSSQSATNFSELQVDDGSASEPAFGFTADTDTGLYRVGANNVGIAVGGSKILDVSSGGVSATTMTVTNLISTSVGFSGATADLSGAVTAGSLAVGGGYGSTGCTLSTAGVLQCNGAATTDGALTAASTVIGGGFGSTGCTLSTAGVLQCDGAATIGGALVVTGTQLFVGQTTESTNIIHSSASITPTDGGILTPTAKLVTLTPAGAVGVEMGACTTGMETVLYNSIASNVVITDTGNGVLAGNQTLGQYDALMLACIGTKWVQVSAISAN